MSEFSILILRRVLSVKAGGFFCLNALSNS